MTRKVSKLIILLVCMFIFPQCTHNYSIDLNPNYFKEGYVVENTIASITPGITFSRGVFTDNRSDQEHIGVIKASGYTHNIVTEDQFGDAFYDGVKSLLSDSNHSWVESGESDVQVHIELLETTAVVEHGGWVVRLASSVSSKMKFVSSKSKEVIYETTYEGINRKKLPPGARFTNFEVTVNKAIVDCINKIGADEKLYKALMKMRS